MKISAGDLSLQHVFKEVSVTFNNGKITSTVTDILTEVRHGRDGVRLFFKDTHWYPPLTFLGTPPDSGLLVGAAAVVEVIE